MITERMTESALRFMGVPPSGRTDGDRHAVRHVFERLQSLGPVRWVWRRAPIALEESGVLLDGWLSVPGRDLTRIFAHCRSCFVLALTLGPAVDRAIALAGSLSDPQALALDACASVWADAECDRLDEEITVKLPPDEYPTMRFSPGYGDVPSSASRGIIQMLDATRRIGLTMTASGMMAPVKSITALIGISDRHENRRRDCSSCGRRGVCSFMKEGETCGG